MAEKKKKPPDWKLIEADYKAGVLSVNAIANLRGVSEPTLRRRAKSNGWIRNAPEVKRLIVADILAGVTNGLTNTLTNDEVRQNQENAIRQDVEDCNRALRINRHCLLGLEQIVESVNDARDIKVIVDATAAAIASIRTIRSLDAPSLASGGNTREMTDDELLAIATGRRQGITNPA